LLIRDYFWIFEVLKVLEQKVQKRFLLSNMLSDCCLRLLQIELGFIGVQVVKAKLGDVVLQWDKTTEAEMQVISLFERLGFGVLHDRDDLLVDELKRVIIELVHHTTFNAMVRNSDFIVSRFDKSYQYLSTVFSKREGITLEKYIILQKIEKVKELLQTDQLSLSEIAYMMGYSSVQYLSTQFRQITGYSVTEYKELPEKERQGIRLGLKTDVR
jgi:AraC family transcriptional regulator